MSKFAESFVNFIKHLWILKFKKYEIANCYVCAIKLAIDIPFFTPFTSYCEHSNQQVSTRSRFERNQLSFLIFISLCFVYLIGNCTTVYWLSTICETAALQCMINVAHTIYSLTVMATFVLFTAKSGQLLNFLNSCCDMVDSYSFVFPNLIRKEFCRKFNVETVVVRWILLGVQLSQIAGVVFANKQDQSALKMVFLVTNVLSRVYMTHTLVAFGRINRLYRCINAGAFADLRLQMADGEVTLRVPQRRFVRHFVRFKLADFAVFTHVNNFLDPEYFLWIGTTSLLLINNLYVTLLVPWTGDYTTELIFLQIEGAINCVYIIFWVVSMDTQRWNEEILAFLFKYPISKLSRADAAQVEMLIATLTLQKPVVGTSSGIVIGSRLLTSISSSVITYVLVALQFRAAWIKN